MDYKYRKKGSYDSDQGSITQELERGIRFFRDNFAEDGGDPYWAFYVCDGEQSLSITITNKDELQAFRDKILAQSVGRFTLSDGIHEIPIDLNETTLAALHDGARTILVDVELIRDISI